MSLHYINSAPWRWRRRRRGEQQSLTQLPISATSVSVEAHICIGKLFHYVSLHFPAAVAEKLSAKHSPLATGKAFNFFLYLHFFIYYYFFGLSPSQSLRLARFDDWTDIQIFILLKFICLLQFLYF